MAVTEKELEKRRQTERQELSSQNWIGGKLYLVLEERKNKWKLFILKENVIVHSTELNMNQTLDDKPVVLLN